VSQWITEGGRVAVAGAAQLKNCLPMSIHLKRNNRWPQCLSATAIPATTYEKQV